MSRFEYFSDREILTIKDSLNAYDDLYTLNDSEYNKELQELKREIQLFVKERGIKDAW